MNKELQLGGEAYYRRSIIQTVGQYRDLSTDKSGNGNSYNGYEDTTSCYYITNNTAQYNTVELGI